MVVVKGKLGNSRESRAKSWRGLSLLLSLLLCVKKPVTQIKKHENNENVGKQVWFC